MPMLISLFSPTAPSAIGRVKLGQPEPDSYLVSLLNNGSSHTRQW